LRNGQLYTVTDDPVERPHSAQAPGMQPGWLDRAWARISSAR
jgi:hypothetical protein